jgi:large subunit ribosomal protein L4
MAEKRKKATPARPKAAARPKRAAETAQPRRGRAAKAAAEPAPATPTADAGVATDGAVQVVNAENKKVRELSLSPAVFGVKVNQHLLYEAVKHQRAGARRGTHMAKNRALVSGSGRKPWKQKGTGRARVGEIRTPLWRHGGTVFGPVPRDYSYAMPRKARAAALRSALSQRVREGALRVVEGFPLEAPKTKLLKGILGQLGVAGKTLLVEHEPAPALVLSGRNIPELRIVDDSHLTVYDVLDCQTLLVSQEAIGRLEERLTP